VETIAASRVKLFIRYGFPYSMSIKRVLQYILKKVGIAEKMIFFVEQQGLIGHRVVNHGGHRSEIGFFFALEAGRVDAVRSAT
jgi:hypothetical protein